MEQLRKRATELNLKVRSEISIDELQKVIEVAENIHCDACLRERLKQGKIDNEVYNRNLMENTIRKLCKVKEEEKNIIEHDGVYINAKTGEVIAPVVEGFKWGY